MTKLGNEGDILKERITQIANGILSYDAARFHIHPAKVTGDLAENQWVRQEVEIRTCNGKPVKGVAYSDCPHVQIKGNKFKGYVNRITIEADAIGLSNGDTLSGEFMLVTEGGEFSIPYSFLICGEKKEQETDSQRKSELQKSQSKVTVKTPFSKGLEEPVKLVLDCLWGECARELIEELEIYLLIWQEDGNENLTEMQMNLLQVFVWYHTGNTGEAKELFEQVCEKIHPDQEESWIRLLILYLKNHLLTEHTELNHFEEMISLMIKSGCVGEAYFSWYHKAACANLYSEELITYYLDSIPREYRGEIARPVILYYTYGDTLSDSVRELLYTNVQMFYSEEERIYSGYRSRIERFAVAHLQKRQINRNLLFLYTVLLHPDMLDEPLAEAVTDMLSLEHVSAADKRAVQAVVSYPLLEQTWSFSLTEGEGEISVWSDDARICCFTSEGEEIEEKSVFRSHWMKNPSMEERCRQLCPSHIRFQTEQLQSMLQTDTESQEEIDQLIALANCLPVCDRVVCQIVSVVIAYCRKHPDSSVYDGVLLGAWWQSLKKEEQENLLFLLLQKGYEKEAESRIRQYGWRGLSDVCLAEFFRQRISHTQGMDDWHVSMCYGLYIRGSREKWLLELLCSYYNHGQEKMLKLLADSREAGCETLKLAERLLVQSFFSGMWQKLPEIMGCYIDAGGQDALFLSCYLVVQSHVYYMTGKADSILENWFTYASLEDPFHGKLPEICCMAVLKWYSEKENLTDEECRFCRPLIEGLLQKDRMYEFYHGFAGKIDLPSSLEGKIILEYHGAENAQIMLVYQRDRLEEEKVLLLQEQYPGVYCAGLFLFTGEELHYRLLADGEYQSVCFSIQKPFEVKNEGCIRLNQAIAAYQSGDLKQVQSLICEMELHSRMCEVLFPARSISEEG